MHVFTSIAYRGCYVHKWHNCREWHWAKDKSEGSEWQSSCFWSDDSRGCIRTQCSRYVACSFSSL